MKACLASIERGCESLEWPAVVLDMRMWRRTDLALPCGVEYVTELKDEGVESYHNTSFSTQTERWGSGFLLGHPIRVFHTKEIRHWWGWGGLKNVCGQPFSKPPLLCVPPHILAPPTSRVPDSFQGLPGNSLPLPKTARDPAAWGLNHLAKAEGRP